MGKFKDIVRSMTPLGVIERNRRKFRLGRLGLHCFTGAYEAVGSCRYDLWPAGLKKASSPWTLVDIGANQGEFTSAVATLAPLKCVHAFEPQPSCQVELRRVLDRIPGSQLHACAVGRETGKTELLCTSNSKMASVLTPSQEVTGDYGVDDFAINERINVPLVRLDDAIPAGTKIGLLKIDVQGYELEVLEGAINTLRSTDALLMEVNYIPHYEGGATFDALYETVRKHGFRTHGISEPYCGMDGPLWADAMFVR